MKARIIRRGVSRIENGVKKGYGETVNITKEELKTGAYALLKINVKPKKKKKDVKAISDKNVQSPSDAKNGDGKK